MPVDSPHSCMPCSSVEVAKLSPPGNSSNPTILSAVRGQRTGQELREPGDSLHLGGAVDKADHAGERLDRQLGHEEWHVGDVGSQEQSIEVFRREFLSTRKRVEEFSSLRV